MTKKTTKQSRKTKARKDRQRLEKMAARASMPTPRALPPSPYLGMALAAAAAGRLSR